MKILFLTIIFGGFLLKNSKALDCMMCEIEDPSQTCDYETCPKSSKYCETLIAKVNGNYSIILSCATKHKCSEQFVENGLEKCKHSKTNTECYTCCNDEDNCNSVEFALNSLPKDAFVKKSSKKQKLVETLDEDVEKIEELDEVKKPKDEKKKKPKKTEEDETLEEIDEKFADYENNGNLAVIDNKKEANNEKTFYETSKINETKIKNSTDDFNANQNNFDSPILVIETLNETDINSNLGADKVQYNTSSEESDSIFNKVFSTDKNDTSSASKTFNSVIVIISSILFLSFFF